jgi:pimeloyl-ACP methyl ester carboxylesterase
MPAKPKQRRQQARFDPNRGSRPPEMIDLVDAGWILKALAGMLVLALVCGYVTLCLVFHYNQWQLVLKPSRNITTTPSTFNLPFTEVHFGVDAAGKPQLDGWWIPSDSPADPTVLLLHSGDGTMSDAVSQAQTLHAARLNVLLFDYRGYGHSAGTHPTEATMEADAETAFAYLTNLRSLPATTLIAYGTGAGGSLAVTLCTHHPKIAALILESPRGDFLAQVKQDPRAHFVPVRLLFNQDFPLADPLHTLSTPKLLISFANADVPPPVIFQRAADPKTTVELPASPPSAVHEPIKRFLGSYVAHPPATIIPNQ